MWLFQEILELRKNNFKRPQNIKTWKLKSSAFGETTTISFVIGALGTTPKSGQIMYRKKQQINHCRDITGNIKYNTAIFQQFLNSWEEFELVRILKNQSRHLMGSDTTDNNK